MIVIDLETTGLEPERNSILSLGAVDFFNPNNQFYGECAVQEGKEIDHVALHINGFTLPEIVSKEKGVQELVNEFIQWSKQVKDNMIGGYYTHFDRSFILEAVKEYRLEWPFGIHIVDVHGLFYSHLLKTDELKPGYRTEYSLDHILVYLGLPKEPFPHNALTGAKVTAEAISRLVLGKNLLKEFEKYPIRYLDDIYSTKN